MATYDLYFKRQKAARGEMPDVYTYDKFPERLKVQIVHAWNDALGNRDDAKDGRLYRLYSSMCDILKRELGQFHLDGAARGSGNKRDEWVNTFLDSKNVEVLLTMVEMAGRAIESVSVKMDYLHRVDRQEIAEGAVNDINQRFKEHGVGYEYSKGEILRIDSELMHSEVVKPALRLLGDKRYSGAQDEFLKAHEYYRHGDVKAALAESLKSLESVMKIICDARGWTIAPNATSKTLIQVLFDKGLVPAYWQSHFSGLRANLEGGVPTARNKAGGHGQGSEIVSVPQHLAGYVLHQAAAAIVFLVEAEKSMT